MKTYYCLIYDKLKDFYYFKVMITPNMKIAEDRLRSCGYVISRCYSEKTIREVKALGKEGYLGKYVGASLKKWEAIEGVEIG